MIPTCPKCGGEIVEEVDEVSGEISFVCDVGCGRVDEALDPEIVKVWVDAGIGDRLHDATQAGLKTLKLKGGWKPRRRGK